MNFIVSPSSLLQRLKLFSTLLNMSANILVGGVFIVLSVVSPWVVADTALEPPTTNIASTEVNLERIPLLHAIDASLESSITDFLEGELPVKTINNGRVVSGFRVANHWLAFSLQNTTPNDLELVMYLDESFHRQVTLYEQGDAGLVVQDNGRVVDVFDRAITSHLPSFPISLAAGEYKSFYILITSPLADWSLGAHVQDRKSFNDSTLFLQLSYGLYFGALLSLLIYNAYLLLMLKEKLYFYYVSYTASFTIFAISYTGFMHYFVSFSDFLLNRIPAFSALFIAFLMLFARELMEMKAQRPLLAKVLKTIAFVEFILFAGMMFNASFFLGIKLVAMFASPLLLITSLFGWYKGYPYARFFSIAYLLYLPGISLLVMENIGITDYSVASRAGYLLGALFELFTLSMLLAYRIKNIQERESATALELVALKNSRNEALQNALERAQSATREVENKQLVQEQMFAVLSHELRTPAATLDMITDQLDATALGDFAQKLKEASSQLLATLDDLEIISKPDQIANVKSETALPGQVTGATLSSLELLLSKADITSHWQFDQETYLPCEFKVKALRQLITQLLNNVVAHSHAQNVWISLTVKHVTSEYLTLELAVEDDGQGIPAQHHALLFEPFYRVDETSNNTGLGLHICKLLCKALGGDIRYFETDKGRARFSANLQLPLANKIRSESISSDDIACLADMRILFVEDNATIRMLSQALLKNHGAYVDVAENGIHALQMFSEHGYDLILTDIFMPEMDGYGLIKALRARGYAGPIYGITAATLGRETDKLLELGANGVLSKPLHLDELCRLMNKASL